MQTGQRVSPNHGYDCLDTADSFLKLSDSEDDSILVLYFRAMRNFIRT